MRHTGTLAPRALLALLVALAVLAARSAPVQGASFTVNATHDDVDASPGDGVCADATGACTLRAAVMETNALPGADEISLPAGTHVLSIPGRNEDASESGDLDLTDDLAIRGAGAGGTVIDAQGIDRVIHSAHDGQEIEVTIASITIQTGDSLDGGGGVFNGRYGRGRLVMRDSIVRDSANAFLGGGGIHNIGIVELHGMTIAGNDGGIDGGGIFNQGTLRVERSRIIDNFANSTGAGIDSGGTAVITDSIIAGNFADFGAGGGGGINNFGTMFVTASTINNNASVDWGGGIGNGGALELTNVTVSGNSAGKEGGGLWNHPLGNAVLRNATITNNNGGAGGGIFAFAGGFPGQVSLINTIVAGNDPQDCNGSRPVVALGHNLDSDGTCGLSGPGDLSGVDPLIGPLADNGGPTQTHALLAGSPAIDGGENSACPPNDQRLVGRPQDGNGDGILVCDIGAFEVFIPPPGIGIPNGPASTPSLPITLPPTGGRAGPASEWPIAIALTLPAVVLGAAIARRYVR